jgi:hypothetical protein
LGLRKFSAKAGNSEANVKHMKNAKLSTHKPTRAAANGAKSLAFQWLGDAFI